MSSNMVCDAVSDGFAETSVAVSVGFLTRASFAVLLLGLLHQQIREEELILACRI